MGILEGKAVVITGAGRGLGAAYAESAASEGAAVVVNDVDGAEAEAVRDRIVAGGGRAVAHVADITHWESAEELVTRCVDEFGAIDGLVNNAGIGGIDAVPSEELDPGHLHRVLEVNLVGTAFCGSRAIRRMLAQGRGSVVNITSGSISGTPGLADYVASKGAVSGLTLSWAADVGPRGVRVNAVAPLAMTRMWDDRLLPRGGKGVPPAERLRPGESAPAVTFLLSDRAAAVNGQLVALRAGELSLMTLPALLEPVLFREHWSPAEVADAFDAELATRVLPPGLGRVRLAPP